jgi:WD40 repeat protein
LPPGLDVSAGLISGTPSALGSFAVVVTVIDSESPAKQTKSNYTIKVIPGALTITTAALRNGVVGFPYNPHCRIAFPSCRPPFQFGLQLHASGGVLPYTWTCAPAAGSVLPPGLTFTSSGLLNGVPTTIGTYNLIFTVTDTQSPAAQAVANLSLMVVYPPPPVINLVTPPGGAVHLPYSFAFTASGVAPLTWSETGALPAGLAFGADGVLAGTPTATGSLPIALVAQDKYGQNSTPQDFTIQIFPHGFGATGSMGTPRQSHTATLLQNGKVLVAGGLDATGGATATAEIFDPATGIFTPTTSNMTTARYSHTATLLTSGKVLLTGGGDATGTAVATAEVFDPSNGSFTSTSGNMTSVRYLHTATLLPSGKVLLAGGLDTNGAPTATAELFDPTNGTFMPTTGNMTSARNTHTATPLAGGNVLLSGGLDATGFPTATAETFDPAAGTFAPVTSNMVAAHASHTATLFPSNGKVLVIGGQDATANSGATAEVFDPTAGTFTSTAGVMGSARQRHTATLLNDGTVLVTGGLDTTGALRSAELFDPSSGTFSPTGSPTSARYAHTATLLTNGKVLVTGGVDTSGAVVATAELYR